MNDSNKKIDQHFVVKSFATKNTLMEYTKAVDEIGLWESEKIYFTKYLPKDKPILDIGCGTGRTTFGLHRLGYEQIVGLDLSEGMIKQAKLFNIQLGIDIPFVVGDATSLPFSEDTFDGALFSFNGWMQIPTKSKRLEALREVKRVLKPGANFIFTTHDREANIEWKWYWDEEQVKWENGEQDERLHEYGDRIIEEKDRMIFLHFPTRNEVIESIEVSGLELLEDAWLPDIVEEPERVRKHITDVRFWVVRKNI